MAEKLEIKELDHVVVRFSGDSGDGMQLAGNIFSTISATVGNGISTFPDYPADIRAPQGSLTGVSGFQVHIGQGKVYTPGDLCDVLVAMNLPSLDKYEPMVKPGGTILVDSSLIERKVTRDDVNVYYIPATKLAGENGAPTLANMILVGKLLEIFGEFDAELVEKALGKCISARHADLLSLNLKCMEIGRDYNA